jgi:L-2-hydroxyglutarate oxidase LhgO
MHDADVAPVVDVAPAFDVAIVGAGIVGLAIARKLAADRSVVVLERNARPALEISSRNSGVIHAGIYYPANSLKTRLCVQGRELLYRYCQQHHVPHQRCGKLIVATDNSEEPGLRALQQQAAANGVALQWWNQQQLQRAEPQLRASAALFSPHSGIIDTGAYALQLMADVQQRGGDVVMHCSVEQVSARGDGFDVITRSGGTEHTLRVKTVINAAGLNAQHLAAQIHGLDARQIPPLYRCKGHYFRLAKASPFSHLVYPLTDKNAAGLGIHATLDIQGILRFGPDTEYIDDADYQVDDSRREPFRAAIARYFPAITASDLIPDYAGIRPKLQAPGAGFHDFVISSEREHGIAGLVNLFGIESPGLTASLAIADHVAALLH